MRVLLETPGRLTVLHRGGRDVVLRSREGVVGEVTIQGADLADVISALARVLGEELLAERVRCTDIDAVWCPACGTCRCPEDAIGVVNPMCPLHGLATKHTKS